MMRLPTFATWAFSIFVLSEEISAFNVAFKSVERNQLPSSIVVSNKISSSRRSSSVVVQMTNNEIQGSDDIKAFNNRNVPVIPFSKVSYNLGSIENKGPFAWMVPYLGFFGFIEGNTLIGAVPVKANSVATNLSNEEIAEVKKKAVEEMTNIGMDERERRNKLGSKFLAAGFVYAIFSSLFWDDGMLSGHLVKLGVLPFFALGRSLKLSSELGL